MTRAGVVPSRQDRAYLTMMQRAMADAVLGALVARGWTQKELANRCGLTEKHVSRVLRGRDEGSFETWQEFATRLQMRWEVRLV